MIFLILYECFTNRHFNMCTLFIITHHANMTFYYTNTPNDNPMFFYYSQSQLFSILHSQSAYSKCYQAHQNLMKPFNIFYYVVNGFCTTVWWLRRWWKDEGEFELSWQKNKMRLCDDIKLLGLLKEFPSKVLEFRFMI